MEKQEENIAIFASSEDYAYHINEVVSVGTESLRVLRKKFSFSTPYKIEKIDISNCVQLTYKDAISPVRMVLGALLITLILALFYFIAYYWSNFEQGQSFRVGLLGLGLAYGVRWAFMSRSHRIVFHMRDGRRFFWNSRSGDFKYKIHAVTKILEFAKERGLMGGEIERRI